MTNTTTGTIKGAKSGIRHYRTGDAAGCGASTTTPVIDEMWGEGHLAPVTCHRCLCIGR